MALGTRRAGGALASRRGPLALIGSDLLALGEVLARPDAEDHCRRLAAWHRARAEAGVRRLGVVLALGLALMTGAVLLAAVAGPVRSFYDAAAWVEPAGAVP